MAQLKTYRRRKLGPFTRPDSLRGGTGECEDDMSIRAGIKPPYVH